MHWWVFPQPSNLSHGHVKIDLAFPKRNSWYIHFFNSFSPIMHLKLPITKHFLILLYYACGMYKSNFNFGAGCSNWAVWADLRFGFVHSTDILEENK